jgi:hypothetical protein
MTQQLLQEAASDSGSLNVQEPELDTDIDVNIRDDTVSVLESEDENRLFVDEESLEDGVLIEIELGMNAIPEPTICFGAREELTLETLEPADQSETEDVSENVSVEVVTD